MIQCLQASYREPEMNSKLGGCPTFFECTNLLGSCKTGPSLGVLGIQFYSLQLVLSELQAKTMAPLTTLAASRRALL
jgi:hypothetical protein